MNSEMTQARPIIFSGESVRAILDGRKTQTRRAVSGRWLRCWAASSWLMDAMHGPMVADEYGDYHPLSCPYGRPGDTLWVRETWAVDDCFDRIAPRLVDCNADVAYRATRTIRDRFPGVVGRWRSPLHMPRWASRITLRVVSVRVERLQEISEADCLAEGIYGPDDVTCDLCGKPKAPRGRSLPFAMHGEFCSYDYCGSYYRDPPPPDCWRAECIDLFREIWDRHNTKRGHSWESNPWVWVVEY